MVCIMQVTESLTEGSKNYDPTKAKELVQVLIMTYSIMVIDIMVMIKIIDNNHREEGHNVILGCENCDKQ